MANEKRFLSIAVDWFLMIMGDICKSVETSSQAVGLHFNISIKYLHFKGAYVQLLTDLGGTS